MTALADPPQHGICELFETARRGVATALIDSQRNRGVGRRLQKQKLSGGGEQNLFEAALVLGQRLCQERG